MFLNLFKKSIANIKDFHDIALLAVMSDEDIFFIFNGSPLYFAMLPMIGLLSTVMALVNGFELSKVNNKNVDRWLGFLVSALCATLTSVSLYGSAIATYYGLNFALGPWFFLASVAVAFTHQLTVLGLNCYRANEASSKSAQRMHYVQAAISTVYHLGIITAIAGALTFIMLTPIAPALGSACALTAVGMTAANLFWKILPATWRDSIKSLVGLAKPKVVDNVASKISSNLKMDKTLIADAEPQCQRLFTKRDYSAEIQNKTFEQGLSFLHKVIKNKIQVYNAYPLPHSEKNEQKKALLSQLLSSLENDCSFSKKRLSKAYPLAFQSFWVETSEVEAIVDAACRLKNKHQVLDLELGDLAPRQCAV